MKRWALKSVVARWGAPWLLAFAWAAQAATPWVWMDEAGRRVFSDIPPPASVPGHRIIRQPAVPAPPSGRPANAPSVQGQEAPAGEAASGVPGTASPGQTVQVENEQQRLAVEQRNAEIRADNCRRAQESLATLQRSGPLTVLNERGQQVIMTDTVRRAETVRAQAIIRENCSP